MLAVLGIGIIYFDKVVSGILFSKIAVPVMIYFDTVVPGILYFEPVNFEC